MNNQNDIYALLKKSGLNADALLKAAKAGDKEALLSALGKTERAKIENVLKNGGADKILSSDAAKDIINRFGEKNNG